MAGEVIEIVGSNRRRGLRDAIAVFLGRSIVYTRRRADAGSRYDSGSQRDRRRRAPRHFHASRIGPIRELCIWAEDKLRFTGGWGRQAIEGGWGGGGFDFPALLREIRLQLARREARGP